MKRASKLTSIISGLLIAGSLVACNQNKTATKAASAAKTQESASIVFVNLDTLLSKYQYATDVNKSIQDKGKAAQSDVQSRGLAFQKEYTDYQKNAGTMSADQRQSTEQRLQRDQQDLQTYQQTAAARLQNEQATEAGKVYDKISDFMKDYSKQKGYKMILTYSKANPTVLYGDSALDVTTDVVKGLNDAYAKEKK